MLDFTQGYDTSDPSKTHHPLLTGRINVHDAINVIHWGKSTLMLIGCALTILWSPLPMWSMFCLFMWYTWGTAYNVGLSKESLFGFIPISVGFTAMGGWAWLLSHESLGKMGTFYLAYVFLTIFFQIAYEGHLKEIKIRERGNLLHKLGAKVENGIFYPKQARLFGLILKSLNLVVAGALAFLTLSYTRIEWFLLMSGISLYLLYKLTWKREYNRGTDLRMMSFMEIMSIYLPIPLLIGWLEASILMLSGVVYFFVVNKILWNDYYPKV